jgi:hypothetical protein
MALHYFATSTSFQWIEDVHLKEAIKILRPDDGLLPNRKQLATTLLDQCHQELKTKVDQHMKNATACLTTDGWSNINNEAVVNYMAVSPGCSLYLEAVQTGQQGHDHEFIAKDVERVFTTYKDTTFAGAVMDNTSANKKAWEFSRQITHPASSKVVPLTAYTSLSRTFSVRQKPRRRATLNRRIQSTTHSKIC